MRPEHDLAPDDSALVHQALLFESSEQHAAELAPLVAGALRDGQEVIAVLDTPVIEGLSSRIGDDAGRVTVRSPADQFHYPMKTLREVETMASSSTRNGRRALIVGEPRFDHVGMDETLWMQIESAYNTVLADAPITMICGYNVRQRSDSVLAGARCTHHQVRDHARLQRSGEYVDLPSYLVEHPAPAPTEPGAAEVLPIRAAHEVPVVRRHVRAWAAHEGMGNDRASDLTVAVNEMVTNAVLHGSGAGSVLMWRTPRALAVEVRNPGELLDDHLGLVRPDGLRSDGRGLWMTRQLCDTVYAWPDADGAHVRIEMPLDKAG